jgi:iron complex outermembrane recepter protein
MAPHRIRDDLLWETKAGYHAGSTFKWVSVKAYLDQAKTLNADPCAPLNFKFGKVLGKGILRFGEAKDLTDEHFAATTGVDAMTVSRSFQPGDGRGVFGGIEWKW